MTVVFNSSRGSIPLIFLFHLLTNLHYLPLGTRSRDQLLPDLVTQ